MAGSPLKRARKQGVRLADGSIIAFPRMPRVADLPPGWRHLSPAEKIERLIGLDRCREILSWGPITERDPLRRSFQMQVMRVLLPIGIKAMLDGSLAREAARERNRAAILNDLGRRLARAIDRGTRTKASGKYASDPPGALDAVVCQPCYSIPFWEIPAAALGWGKNGGRLGIWVRFQDDAGRRRDRDGSILRPAPFSAAAIGLPAWVARESFVVRSMLTFV